MRCRSCTPLRCAYGFLPASDTDRLLPGAREGCWLQEAYSFADEPWFEASSEDCLARADALLEGRATWFSCEHYVIGSPPDWFLDPSSGQRFQDGSQHWSRCKPFAGADIKRCWELSRLGLGTAFARAWRLSGDRRYRDRLNAWSQSWCHANP